MNKNKKFWLICFLCILLVFTAACGNNSKGVENGEANSQEKTPSDIELKPYPTKPIKIVVGHAAGGSTDLVPRLLQPYLQKALNTPVVIENIEGSGGMIAANTVYNAEPDGYTLLTIANPTYALIDMFQKNAPPFKEFRYIGNVAGGESTGIAVSPSSDIKTYNDLIEKAKKGKILYACTSGLSNSTLGYVLLSDTEGVKFTKVPYESGSRSVSAVIGGHADVTITSTMTLTPLINNGELNVLTYFAEKSLPGYENIPLYSDMHPGVGYSAFIGLAAPPKTPDYIVEALQKAVEQAVKDPEFIASASGKYFIDFLGGEDYEKKIFELYEKNEELREAVEATMND